MKRQEKTRKTKQSKHFCFPMTCNCPLCGRHLNGNDSSRPFYCDVWTWQRLGNSIYLFYFDFSCCFICSFWSSCLHFPQLIGYDDDGFCWTCVRVRRLYVDVQIKFMMRSLAGYFMKLSIVIRRCTHQKPIQCTCVKMWFFFRIPIQNCRFIQLRFTEFWCVGLCLGPTAYVDCLVVLVVMMSIIPITIWMRRLFVHIKNSRT